MEAILYTLQIFAYALIWTGLGIFICLVINKALKAIYTLIMEKEITSACLGLSVFFSLSGLLLLALCGGMK